MTPEIYEDSDFLILTTEEAACISLWQGLNQHPKLHVNIASKKQDIPSDFDGLTGALLTLPGLEAEEVFYQALAQYSGQVLLLVPNPVEMARHHYNRLWWRSVGQSGVPQPPAAEVYFAQSDMDFYRQFDGLGHCLRLQPNAQCIELRQNANSARHATLKRLCQALGVGEQGVLEPCIDYDDMQSEIFRQYEVPVVIEGVTLTCHIHYGGANPFPARYHCIGQLPKAPRSSSLNFQAAPLDFYLLQDSLQGVDQTLREDLHRNVVGICHMAFDLCSHRLRVVQKRHQKYGLSGLDKRLKQQIRERLHDTLKSLYAQQPSWQKRWAA